MAPGIGDASMGSRTGDDLSKVLAELQASGSIHFHKTLARRSQQLGFTQCERLTLPSWFVEEHGDKFEEWVILRTLSSAKPWRVHLGIRRAQDGCPQVLLNGGWKQFVAENRIEEGDSLVFALNVAARSEFQVDIFRESETTSSSTRNRLNADHFTRVSEQKVGSLSHGRREEQQKNVRVTGDSSVEKKKTVHEARRQEDQPESACDEEYSGDSFSENDTGNEQDDLASQHGADSFPNFEKRITTTVMRDNYMEIPASFAKTHGMKLQDDIEVQGIHQESPVLMVKLCWRRHGTQERLYFKARWGNYFKENGLRAGQQLRFTLKADSFFVVRRVRRR